MGERLPLIPLWGLFIIASGYAMVAAGGLLLPIAVAAVLSAILSRPCRILERAGLPSYVASAIIAISLLATTVTAVGALIIPFETWMDRAPAIMRGLEIKLRPVLQSIERVEKATEQVEQAAEINQKEEGAPQTVVVAESSLISNFALSAPFIAFQFFLTFVLVFFMLAERRSVARALVSLPRTFGVRRRTAAFCRDMQRDVAGYLFVVTCINLGLGVATTGVFYLIGFPNPALWGTGMGLLNFIPFLGPLTMMVVTFGVGLVTYPQVELALLAPGCLLLLNVIESQVVFPLAVGRRLTVSPLMIFIAVVAGGWAWGIVGTVIAVPAVIVLTTWARHFRPGTEAWTGQISGFRYRQLRSLRRPAALSTPHPRSRGP